MNKRFLICLIIFFSCLFRELNTASVISEESIDFLYDILLDKEPPLNQRYISIQSYFNKIDGCLSYEFLKYIDECLIFYEVSPYISLEMFISLIFVESRFIEDSKSSAGAYGLTQIMKNTERIINNIYSEKVDGVFLDRKDPYDNVLISILYLKDLLDRHSNDLESAIRFYNGGTKWKNKKSTKKYYYNIVNICYKLIQYVKIDNLYEVKES